MNRAKLQAIVDDAAELRDAKIALAKAEYQAEVANATVQFLQTPPSAESPPKQRRRERTPGPTLSQWKPNDSIPDALPRSSTGKQIARGALRVWLPRLIFTRWGNDTRGVDLSLGVIPPTLPPFDRASVRDAANNQWPSDKISRQSIDATVAHCEAKGMIKSIPDSRKFRWVQGVQPP